MEYEYEYEYSSVADLQRDHRAIDWLALTDGQINICCFVASLHPQFLGQLVQRTACSAVCRHAVVKCSTVVEAAAADGSKQLLSSSGNTNAFRKYLGKGKIVHGVSCSGEDYKSSLSAGGCLEIHNLKLLAGCQPFPDFLSVLQLQTLGRLSLRALN
ncbi:unnamed protein product [Sphagnum troendelagicum]|uniref:Uncharacterized protein n=1 Tax=Sphagnum troendelagicum TaxID=128251 RepID=A0ABP0V3A3_9BRYO